jgi:hypothetical protein
MIGPCSRGDQAGGLTGADRSAESRKFRFPVVWAFGLGILIGGALAWGGRGLGAETAGRSSAEVSPGGLDAGQIARMGIRRLEGNHLILYTDLPPQAEVDALPEVFDQAFEPFCAYFALDPDKHTGWRMRGCLMRDPERFRRVGLLPADLPKFVHGFTKGYDFWIYEQPSAYYRRHLMLHEGVHGLMLTLLGSCGPTWYMEGIAELLATHRWEEGRLVVKYLPRSAEEVPMWGRVKIVRDSVQRRGPMSVEELIRLVPEISGENELYGWCWALAVFLDSHPRYQSAFRQMVGWVRARDFTERFFRLVGQDRALLDEEWKLFVDEICYGYDFARCAIRFVPSQPIPAQGVQVRVEVDRGWQSSGWQVEAGRTYRLIASGRYQVAQKPKVWWCEPGGVTIRYYRGRPLGMLLAAIRAESSTGAAESGAGGPGRLPGPALAGPSDAAESPSAVQGLNESSPTKPPPVDRRDNWSADHLQAESPVPPSGQTASRPSKQQPGLWAEGRQENGLQTGRREPSGQTASAPTKSKALPSAGTSGVERPLAADGLPERGRSGLLQPIPIGLEATLKPSVSGTLYFRINESPAELGDNAGELTVRIIPVP